MPWWMTAAAEWTLAQLPGGPQLHARLQDSCGRFDHRDIGRQCDDALWFVNTARRWCGELSNLRVVALGTGSSPALPLALLLCGARVEVHHTHRLTNRKRLQSTLGILRERASKFSAAAEFPSEMFRRRLDVVDTSLDFESACQALCGRYGAPSDMRNLPPDDGAADLVISDQLLQYLPADSLRSVLQESSRVLRPRGFAIHRLRMTDDYARQDRRRNHLEYLKYSEATWNRWFSHRLKHQNRLRASQFLSLFGEPGFECRWTGRAIDGRSLKFIEHLPLPDEFEGLELQDLATINLNVVLQRPVSGGVAEAAGAASAITNSGELHVFVR